MLFGLRLMLLLPLLLTHLLFRSSPGGDDSEFEVEEPTPPIPTGDGAAGLAGQLQTYQAQWRAALGKVRREAAKYRTKAREAEAEVATLKERAAPDGGRTLTAEEARAYDAYVALGKPDEVQTKLGQVETLSAELGGLKRDSELRDVAAAYGYDFDGLREFAGELPVAAYEAEVDGEKKTRYRIGEGQSQADVAEWVKGQKPHVQRALAVTSTPGTGQQQGGVRVPVQGSGERPASTNAVQALEQYHKQTYGARQQQS